MMKYLNIGFLGHVGLLYLLITLGPQSSSNVNYAIKDFRV